MKKFIFETDFSYDFLRWMRLCDRYKLTPRYLPDKQVSNSEQDKISELQQTVIKSNDPAMAYFFALDFPYQIYKMQKIILTNKNSKYAFLFAQNIQLCDIDALQKVVIGAGQIKYICKFACFVHRANGKVLEKLIVEAGKPQYAYLYLQHKKPYNLSKLGEIILSSKKPKYLLGLVKHTTDNKQIEIIEDLIIASGSVACARSFALNVRTANIEKLEQFVMRCGTNQEIKKFARSVKGSKLKNFLIL